jgi:membrane protein required for beta-lactamase induction
MQLSTRGKWIFLSLAALCAITTIIVPIITHSIHNAWYGLATLLFILSIYNISLGTKKLRIEHQNGQTAIWYKEFMINLGIMCLLLSLLESVVYGISANLSDSIGLNMTYGAIGILGAGIIIFFILIMKYKPNRASVL